MKCYLFASNHREFKNNPELTEIPFTSYKLTLGEIACMIEEADNLGLKAVQVGSVSVKLCIIIMKYCKPTFIFICGQGIFVRSVRAS